MSFDSSGDDSAHNSQWDNLQSSLHCCGTGADSNGYKNWRNATIWQKHQANKYNVPDSCCNSSKPIVQDCGKIRTDNGTQVERNIYIQGCSMKMYHKLRENVNMAIGLGITVFLLQMIAATIACRIVYIALMTDCLFDILK